jgi:DNA-binding NarL/FixJ family response regulator
MSQLERIRVSVIDEQEIFRLGIVACLLTDPQVDIVHEAAAGFAPDSTDVGVVSARALRQGRHKCRLVVCANELSERLRRGQRNRVSAMLPRTSLTREQLMAAVRAAAAGLQVNVRGSPAPAAKEVRLDARRREVLRLLAAGADTATISESLCYSVRTIKGLIQDIERELSAASRAQAVAEGMRQGII